MCSGSAFHPFSLCQLPQCSFKPRCNWPFPLCAVVHGRRQAEHSSLAHSPACWCAWKTAPSSPAFFLLLPASREHAPLPPNVHPQHLSPSCAATCACVPAHVRLCLQACLLRRRMRQDPSLGQAAALHECAVKRMKSSQAAEAAADPATAAGDREHGRTSTIAGVCSPRSSSGPDDSRGGVARSWEDAPAQRGAGGGHGGGNSDCASEQRRNDSGDNFDYNDAERLGQEFGSNEASSSQGGSKSMGMSSNECWGERVTASPTRFSHECSTSISSTSTISSSTSTTSTSCSDGGSSGNKNNCGISSDVRDGSGKADTAECLPDPSGAGAPLAVSLGDKVRGWASQ